MECDFLKKHPNALEAFKEMKEWLAFGFYEAVAEKLPWPRPFGRALERLYENDEIEIMDGRTLMPCEPFHTYFNPKRWLFCQLSHSYGLSAGIHPKNERSTEFPQYAELLADFESDMKPRLPVFGGYTHSNPDIERVIREGFDSIEKELDEELEKLKSQGEAANKDELDLLLSLKDFAKGVRAWHANVCKALDKKLESVDGKRAKELTIIRDNFKKSFFKPAENFIQGLLAANMVWLLDICDSIGRFDQYLGPLFEKDLADGTLDIDFARELLDDLFRSFERYNAWNFQIGGAKPDGGEGFNKLSHEIILACRRQRLIRPNVAFRVAKTTPESEIIETMKTLREGCGRPALYNDELYVKRLLEIAPDLGLRPEDVRDFGFGGCTETMFPGKSNIGSTEGNVNLAKALELALRDGFDVISGRQYGIHTGKFESFKSFDQFKAAVKRQMQFLQDEVAVQLYAAHLRRFKEGDPKLCRTLFTRDCVKNRKSFEAGGARYNGTCVIYQGAANMIDSLAAVKKLVFDERSVAPQELLAALDADFEGCEKLKRLCAEAPKFGNDAPYVDDLAAEMMRFAYEDLYTKPHARNGRYLPHSAVFTTYANAGKGVAALPDGRRKGTPLSDSTGPYQGRDVSGVTAMLKSVAKIPSFLAIGTTTLNVRFQKKTLSSDAGLKAAAKLLRAFFDMGGMQMQISVISKEEMQAARKEPEKHRDLIVRIGGFSEYYTKLDGALQEAVLARTEHQEA